MIERRVDVKSTITLGRFLCDVMYFYVMRNLWFLSVSFFYVFGMYLSCYDENRGLKTDRKTDRKTDWKSF